MAKTNKSPRRSRSNQHSNKSETPLRRKKPRSQASGRCIIRIGGDAAVKRQAGGRPGADDRPPRLSVAQQSFAKRGGRPSYKRLALDMEADGAPFGLVADKPGRGGVKSRAASTTDCVFEMTNKRPFISDEQLLDQLRTFAKTLGGRAFAVREFDAWGGRCCSGGSVSARFGSWAAALAAAGIVGGVVRQYTAEEMIERLERAWRVLGRPPGVVSIRRHGQISPTPYLRHWGSLGRACKQLVRFKRGEITRAELLRGSKSRRRRPLDAGLRWRVLERDGHRCKACGVTSEHAGVMLEVDHIVPVSAGGNDEMSNLRTLCGTCNRGRGDRVSLREKRGRVVGRAA